MKIIFLFFAFFILSGAAVHAETAQDLNNKIQALWDANDFEKALALAKDGSARFPQDAELLGRYGYCFKALQRGDYGTALLEKAYAMDPSHWAIKIWIVDACLAYGWTFYSTDPEKTIRLWSRALEINPELPEYYCNIGKLYADRTETAAKSFPWFEKALAKGYTDKAQLLYCRATAYMNLARFEESEKDFIESLRLDPESPYRTYVFASMEYKKGDKSEWARILEKDLGFTNSGFIKDQEVNIRENLASYYWYGPGLFGKARAQYEKLMAAYPGHKDRPDWEAGIDGVSDRQVTVTMHYQIEDRSVKKIEIGLPVQNAWQKHTACRFDPAPVKYRVYSRFGNRYAELEYAKMPAEITASVDMALLVRSLAEGGFQFDDPDDTPDRHTGRYTDSYVLVDPSDPAIIKLAKEIVKDEKDDLAKAKKIQDWVVSNFTYKVVYPRTMTEYFATRQGECGGFALVFTTLCRAAGIPARRVFTPSIGYPDDKTLGSHETSEFYISGLGWIPVNNTDNVFGATSGCLSLWRNGKDGDPEGTIYPEFTRTTLSYTSCSGKKKEMRGG